MTIGKYDQTSTPPIPSVSPSRVYTSNTPTTNLPAYSGIAQIAPPKVAYLPGALEGVYGSGPINWTNLAYTMGAYGAAGIAGIYLALSKAPKDQRILYGIGGAGVGILTVPLIQWIVKRFTARG